MRSGDLQARETTNSHPPGSDSQLFQSVTQKQLATELGIAPSQVSTLKRKGMPVHEGVEACRAWREAHVAYRSSSTGQGEGDCQGCTSSPAKRFRLPKGTDVYSARDRLRGIERTLAGKLEALEQTARESGETQAISSRLTALRKQHREASLATLSYETAIIALEVKRGRLVSVEASDTFALSVITPIVSSIKGITRWAKDDVERARFAEIGKRLLSDVAESSHLAARACVK